MAELWLELVGKAVSIRHRRNQRESVVTFRYHQSEAEHMVFACHEIARVHARSLLLERCLGES